jgi:hypothetical protein
MKKAELPPKPCLHCGKMFGRESCGRVSDFKAKKYCSRGCYSKSKSGEGHHLYRPLEERFYENIEKEVGGCWIWKGYSRCSGVGGKYGGLKVGGKAMLAHRISYQIHYGEIPNSLFVLHRCDNPSCVNPEHLFLGTNADNMKDMAEKFRGCNGEKGVHSKLTANKVVEIRFAAKRGNMLHREIAKVFGVSTTTITKIVNNHYWKHI